MPGHVPHDTKVLSLIVPHEVPPKCRVDRDNISPQEADAPNDGIGIVHDAYDD
jgi:hypothetical protein